MHDETVRLMHHDHRWRQEYQQTRSSILMCCEGWVTDTEHIGSTAVPGVIARPTIDVVATTQGVEGIEPAALLIEGLNFRRETAPTWAKDAVVLVKPRNPAPDAPDPTHRVFLVVEKSSLADRTVRLRDHLRGDPEMAIRWEEIKVASWRECEGDLPRYDHDKSIFFAHLEDQLDAAGEKDTR